MTSRSIEVLADADAVAARGAESFVACAQEAVAARGSFAAALSGGETPRALYRHLARRTSARKIAWQAVHLYWGDERCVPPDDPASNHGMARDAFIGRVPIPDGNVHRMRGEDVPQRAADAYDIELRALARRRGASGGLPVFDLVLLGLGVDGHTASLFPHSAALDETARRCVVDQGAGTGPRLTITLPVINAAGRVVFVVTGAAKARVVAEVLEGPRTPGALPAQAVAPTHGALTWLVDEAAATGLRASPDV